jgi:hypothetical protein
MKCPGCGEWFDMRDLAQVLAHVHGEEIEIGERPLAGTGQYQDTQILA